MALITWERGGYKFVATEQSEPNVWLCQEFSGGNIVNTFAATTAKVMSTLWRSMSTQHAN